MRPIYISLAKGLRTAASWGKKVGWDWNYEFEFLAGLKEKYQIEDSNSPFRGREKKWKKL
ncbi:MAG: hypothetical protein WCT26_02820 [Candidatus Buchananbacteria bacterium]|jgi:hypothetical protein